MATLLHNVISNIHLTGEPRRGLGDIVNRAITVVLEHHQRRRELHQLLAMDDRALKDIGLTRTDALQFARGVDRGTMRTAAPAAAATTPRITGALIEHYTRKAHVMRSRAVRDSVARALGLVPQDGRGVMIAMHYGFDLPGDFDMRRIRQRVAEKGAAFDRHPGLTLKAFLMSERGTSESRNFYGAFYVWSDSGAARNFLLGPKFAAVADAFGRPEVRIWPVVGFAARDPAPARSATLDLTPVTGDDWQEDLESSCRCLVGGHHAAIVAVDPARWESVRFDLWRDEPAAIALGPTARRFEVLHVSQPLPAFAAA